MGRAACTCARPAVGILGFVKGSRVLTVEFYRTVRPPKTLRVTPQVHGFVGLSGAQRLAILDALVHAAADSEGLRMSALAAARKQVCRVQDLTA